jgi:hypothetical protein
MDLGNSPRKLVVMFNGWDLLGKIDASTPLLNVIDWVSRMILVSCGHSYKVIESIRIAALSVMSKLNIQWILRRSIIFVRMWYMSPHDT